MIKEIQGLRCWAILMVIFLHLTIIIPPEYRKVYQKIVTIFESATGVELLFVIAGFFLMKSLSKYNNKSILEFIISKFRRLAPQVYFWVFITLLLSLFTNSQELWLSPSVMLQKFFATIIWLRNFNEGAQPTHLGYFWAISLEFQTFLLFALSYFILGKRITLIISALLCFVMMFYRWGEQASWVFRFDPILYGVLTYCLVEKLEAKSIHQYFYTSRVNVILASFILILTLSSNQITFINYPNFKTSISALLSSFMLLLALSNNGYFYSKIRILEIVIQWIATRSYALFCCHIVSWLIVKQIFISLHIELSLSMLFWLQISFMILSAELSYRYIENYFIKS